MTLMVVVTMRRFLGDGVARKADRQSDRSDKALDHGSTLAIKKRRTSPRVYFRPPRL